VDPGCTSGKFFFTLQTKGSAPVMTQEAMDNVQRQAGNTDAAGNILVVEAPKPDPVDKSLALRIKSGNLTNQVPVTKTTGSPLKKAKEPVEIVFKLRQKGSDAVLAEAKRDASLIGEAAAAEPIVPEKKYPPCAMELSLGARVKSGAL